MKKADSKKRGFLDDRDIPERDYWGYNRNKIKKDHDIKRYKMSSPQLKKVKSVYEFKKEWNSGGANSRLNSIQKSMRNDILGLRHLK